MVLLPLLLILLAYQLWFISPSLYGMSDNMKSSFEHVIIPYVLVPLSYLYLLYYNSIYLICY